MSKIALFLTLSLPAAAQNPFVGTWKLNPQLFACETYPTRTNYVQQNTRILPRSFVRNWSLSVVVLGQLNRSDSKCKPSTFWPNLRWVAFTKGDLLRPERANHVWSYDFVSARTQEGRRLRILTLLDEYTRECLALRVARRMGSREVIETLSDVMLW